MATKTRPSQAEVPIQRDPPVVLSKFAGLKNTVDRERLGPDELEYAINIDLDDVGQVHTRRGRTLVASGAFSSLFESDESIIYAVKDGTLGVVNLDFSFSPLQSGFPTDWNPLAYVQVGKEIYFSSRTIAGIINQEKLTVSPWIGPTLGGTPPTTNNVQAIVAPNYWYSPVVNPTVTLPPIKGKLLGPPPLAKFLAYFNGRIYAAHGRLVWFTELYNYLYVDKTKGFWQFEADVTMIGSVSDGLYVGTTEGVWFIHLAEGGALEPRRVRVMDSGAIPGSMIYIPGELANPQQVGLNQDEPLEVSILFLTAAGYCGGKDGGVCYNYTESKFIFPDAQSAQAMYRFQDGVHSYVAVTNSGGSPSTNARIGDHLDVTLIKNAAWNGPRDCVKFGDELSYQYIPA